MIRVIAKFNLKNSEVEKALTLARELVEKTVIEDGCLSYNLAQSMDDESIIVIIENWTSQEALDKHSNSEHFTRLVPQIADLCNDAPSVTSYKQII